MRFLNIKGNHSALGGFLTYCMRSMRIRITNRLLFEIGTKKLKQLLDPVQPKNVRQYFDRRVIHV